MQATMVLVAACALPFLFLSKTFRQWIFSLCSANGYFQLLLARHAIRSYQQAQKKKLGIEITRENFFTCLRIHDKEWKLDGFENFTIPAAQALDSTLIHGAGTNGDQLLMRIERTGGHHGDKFALIFKHKDELYTLPRSYNQPKDPFTIDSKCRLLKGNGVTLEVLEPFRRWRVLFTGYLRKVESTEARINENEEHENLVFVRMVFRWACNSNLYIASTSTYENLITQSIAKQPRFSRDNLKLGLQDSPLHMEQWGQLLGTVVMGEGAEQEMLLRGIRRRFKSSHSVNIARSINFYSQEGRMGSIGEVTNCAKLTMPFGCLNQPYRAAFPVESSNFSENFHDLSNYVCFTAGQFTYMVKITSAVEIPLCQSPAACCSILLCQFDINSEKAWGFREHTNENCCAVEDSIAKPTIEQSPSIGAIRKCLSKEDRLHSVLPLDHWLCQHEEITGGKGANLARLIKFQSEFVVPSGFVITTAAHKKFLSANPTIKSLIQSQLVPEQRSAIALDYACQRITSEIERCDIGDELRSAISTEFQRQFSTMYSNKFAVRSSAVGEDSADLSTAGQMDTFLNVSRDQIEKSILKCWASQYSYIIIQYKIQHGQSLSDNMAVVIQKMVNPRCAGVMFTCDPVTQDPLTIVINSATGVGAAVVDGNTKPDSWTVKRNYYNNQLTIVSRELGSSNNSQDGLTKQLTLNDKELERLCKIGIELESSFSSPVDIEWALNDNVFYLLQSRPITTMGTETAFEMLHEFDSGTVCETDYYTTGNVGEVMPKAQSPLSISAGLPCLDKAMQWFFTSQHGIVPYAHRQICIYRNRGLLNLMDGFYASVGWLTDAQRRAPEVIMLGHPVTEFPVAEDTRRRYPQRTKLQEFSELVKIFKGCFWDNFDGEVNELQKLWLDFKIGEEIDNPDILFDEIQNTAQHSLVVIKLHIKASHVASVFYSMGIDTFLQRHKVWSPEHYTDISNLYTSAGDVISADVPAAIQKLAHTIFRSSDKKAFLQMTDMAKAVSWLQTYGPGEVVSEFNSFLDKHGHRCLREIDFAAKAWEMDPSPLVPILQAMAKDERSFTAKTETLTPAEAIANLQTAVSYGGKKFLQFLIPRARKAVAMRETTKSLAILVTHKIRKAYLRLGEMLFEEGRLPEPSLIFYMTAPEIEILIHERSAKIVALSVRRKKLMPAQDEILYPEIMRGYPQPIIEEDSSALQLVSFVSGTPVCQGCVVGIARVALTPEEASLSQAGDILITRSTDIGWSPYFPMVSGVVTEIGGLLSHGAVVAREYGLPCLINAVNATNLVKTGDKVRLNASKGRLEIIERS